MNYVKNMRAKCECIRLLNESGIKTTSIMSAVRFAQLVQDAYGCPTMMIEEDGSIELEWYNENKSVLTLSFNENKISYAYLLRDRKGSGVDYFDAETIPTTLEYALKGLIEETKRNWA